MRRGIGYYVHHHGAGHRERARRIAESLETPCTLIGTFGASAAADLPAPVLDLADDRRSLMFDGRDGEGTRPLSLHYAPLSHAGVRARMAAIADWIARAEPALLVVDVSVEVALLARLLSVPTVYVRLAGERTDPAHLEAFRCAERLIAPFPRAFESERTPEWVRAKTVYAGLLSAGERAGSGEEDGRIVVLLGRGGTTVSADTLATAARAVPGRGWHVLGAVEGAAANAPMPANLRLHGWTGDVDHHVARAAIVVGGAGDGVLAAVAGAGKRFVCLPEERPYGEQIAKAVVLDRMGAAVMHRGWPRADAWPGLVERALAIDPGLIARLAAPDAVARVAGVIDALADGLPRSTGTA